MCVGEGYFFFFLPVFFFAFFAFLAMLPSMIPKVGSMQVDLDMHEHRVHHNCKNETARFEEGKRWSRAIARCGWERRVGKPQRRLTFSKHRRMGLAFSLNAD